MDILIIGSRGREHALAITLKKDPRVENIYCLPGNGGIEEIGICVKLDVTDEVGILQFLDEHPSVELTVIDPDESLLSGLADKLNAAGHRAFGCNARAAQLEASKKFSHDFCVKYGIPCPSYEIFDSYFEAKQFIKSRKYPIVIKTEGRTSGKGSMFCHNIREAENTVYDMMIAELFGEAGKRLDIEEFLEGDRVIVMTLTDGKTLYPLPAVSNFKRVFDGDMGLSTPGMGAAMPASAYTPEIAELANEKIFKPTLQALREEGVIYRGVLGFSLIIGENSVKVVDFISRFCDVESQLLFSQIKTPLLDVMEAIIDDDLARIGGIEVTGKSGVCVVATSGGYPLEYSKGYKIIVGNIDSDVQLYQSGTKTQEGELRTAGGRVLSLACWGEDIPSCATTVYKNLAKINYEGMHYRKDIGMLTHPLA